MQYPFVLSRGRAKPRTRIEGSFDTPFRQAQRLLRTNGLALLLLIAACEKPPRVVLDGSSPQAFEQTRKAARRQIPDADRLVFDRAIRTVGGRRLANNDPKALARVTFDGMTAEQIVADQKAREQ